ncbi:MAG: hypothetical protein K1X52_05875 [Pyrinomonadaceae bacterium]|nr:hypothetical protein [Pyrinomonadaceae bacterium]
METPIHISQTQAILWVMAINAVIGFILGLIPLLFGYFSKQMKLGLIAIAVTTIGGAIIGIIVSIPGTIIFTWLVARNAKRAKNVGFPPTEE